MSEPGKKMAVVGIRRKLYYEDMDKREYRNVNKASDSLSFDSIDTKDVVRLDSEAIRNYARRLLHEPLDTDRRTRKGRRI